MVQLRALCFTSLGALATRHATTATPSVGMDAVRIAQMLSPDGLALLCCAVSLTAFAALVTVPTPAQGVVQRA